MSQPQLYPNGDKMRAGFVAFRLYNRYNEDRSFLNLFPRK